jgi:hypothetical protein
MSKVSVTQAVYDYLQPNVSNIAYLGTVYTALPAVSNEADLFTNTYPGLGLGAVIYMFMTEQSEKRIALGGPHNGRKWRAYNLGMLIVFKSDLGSVTLGLGQTPTEAGQAAFDTFIDSLTTYIQADRNAGDPSVVFQWGEGDTNGGDDLRFEYSIPRLLDGGVNIYQAVAHINVVEVQDT